VSVSASLYSVSTGRCKRLRMTFVVVVILDAVSVADRRVDTRADVATRVDRLLLIIISELDFSVPKIRTFAICVRAVRAYIRFRQHIFIALLCTA
jgi:hypothetical protein